VRPCCPSEDEQTLRFNPSLYDAYACTRAPAYPTRKDVKLRVSAASLCHPMQTEVEVGRTCVPDPVEDACPAKHPVWRQQSIRRRARPAPAVEDAWLPSREEW
jgi:hypothetical protein